MWQSTQLSQFISFRRESNASLATASEGTPFLPLNKL